MLPSTNEVSNDLWFTGPQDNALSCYVPFRAAQCLQGTNELSLSDEAAFPAHSHASDSLTMGSAYQSPSNMPQ